MLRLAVAALWFLLPAGVANTAPVLVCKVPLLDIPVDLGVTWRGAPLFGRNKTWRGIAAAVLAGLLVFWLQQLAIGSSTTLRSLVPSSQASAPVWWGAVIGAGAIAGDLAKSFFKRRAAIPPGHSWFPFDQIDYSIGALIALAPWAFPGWRIATCVIAVGLALHVAAVSVGRALRLRERWI